MDNYDSKLRSIISLAIGFALSVQIVKADPADDAQIRQELLKGLKPNTAPTPALPEGDQHVVLLAEELDDVASAGILFKRCIDQDRPNAQVINAANVLADSYERLCVHASQFYFWIKYWSKSSGKTSDFSADAQNRLHDLTIRINTVIQDSMQDIGDALGKKPRYTQDPALIAVAKRMLTDANTTKTLKEQADKQ
jgi:hypothetical protein